jgi:RNA-directed DNA polymerase
MFHPDSYGYRPGRSALDAVDTCRERCRKFDWVIDLDLRSFFDSIDHQLLLKTVSKHTNLRWVLLYVERWLHAPLQGEDGTLRPRDRGTPQGSAISPLLANLFLHYAFDRWLTREHPYVSFERYADDAVVHCSSRAQARYVLGAIKERLEGLGLELHPDKTRIVYCKDDQRRGQHDHVSFDFLSYTFRRRTVRSKAGKLFDSFAPAVSDAAAREIRHTIRRWRLHQRVDKSLMDLARWINPIVRGWTNYYGHHYKSRLYPTLRLINDYLVRWAQNKYKRLRGHIGRTWKWLASVARRAPVLFAHWRLGALP